MELHRNTNHKENEMATEIFVTVGERSFTAVDAGWTKNGSMVFDIYDEADEFVSDFTVSPLAVMAVDVEIEAIKAIQQELCYA